MKDFRHGNVKIFVYTECAGMSINIPNIMRIIQFRIADFIALPELLEQFS